MRRDIEIDAEDTILRGRLYLPEGAKGRPPVVVMAHGFSAVKKMYLDRFAEVFCQAGIAALVCDNRNFGASGGEPRQEIDPWQQVRDYSHAITWVASRAEMDADRIGVWGSSYSRGHVPVVGAIDRRIKFVVSAVPLVSGSRNLKRLIWADMMAAVRKQFDNDRDARWKGAAPAMMPVVAEDPMAPAWLPTRTRGNGSPRPDAAARAPSSTK